MLHINIICVGKLKEKYLIDAINEYSKRLSKYCELKITELQDEKIPSNLSPALAEQIKQKESSNILEHLDRKSYTITLDLRGKQLSSEDFSKTIEDISVNSSSSITFIIGGSLGLSTEVLDASNLLLCFSKMTFPHQLIRVFLLEQIFRSFKIINNETYHR